MMTGEVAADKGIPTTPCTQMIPCQTAVILPITITAEGSCGPAAVLCGRSGQTTPGEPCTSHAFQEFEVTLPIRLSICADPGCDSAPLIVECTLAASQLFRVDLPIQFGAVAECDHGTTGPRRINTQSAPERAACNTKLVQNLQVTLPVTFEAEVDVDLVDRFCLPADSGRRIVRAE